MSEQKENFFRRHKTISGIIFFFIFFLILGFIRESFSGGTSTSIKGCIKVCSGDEYDKSYVRDHWDTICSLSYQYGGTERLERQIKTCEENKKA